MRLYGPMDESPVRVRGRFNFLVWTSEKHPRAVSILAWSRPMHGFAPFCLINLCNSETRGDLPARPCMKLFSSIPSSSGSSSMMIPPGLRMSATLFKTVSTLGSLSTVKSNWVPGGKWHTCNNTRRAWMTSKASLWNGSCVKISSCKNWQFDGSTLREPRSRYVFIQSGYGYLPLQRNRINIHSNNFSFREAIRGCDSPIEFIVIHTVDLVSGFDAPSTATAPEHNID